MSEDIGNALVWLFIIAAIVVFVAKEVIPTLRRTVTPLVRLDDMERRDHIPDEPLPVEAVPWNAVSGELQRVPPYMLNDPDDDHTEPLRPWQDLDGQWHHPDQHHDALESTGPLWVNEYRSRGDRDVAPERIET